jgi:excisionase family DNA binding protein
MSRAARGSRAGPRWERQRGVKRSRAGPDPPAIPRTAKKGGEASEPLVDATVIAELLSVPETWVLERARAGTIPHYRLGRYVRFRVSEVLAWVEECRAGGRVAELRRYHPDPQKPSPPRRANDRRA